ncbi:ArdC family protein [Pelagibacterium luteolum]|uniref:Antirestriction protein ArdC n=1 Tax=Pelagibacterium luteolum TaxID=440168 RepID=A0A1G8A006_9HYPH|nr:zincin-like metallopeptidase domain-containing protein [Pelagibacterium luteolum]SDH14279.1 Antirestriction protein ArdC [Pelagibacterium luteolum]
MNPDIYTQVTERIIADLEQGQLTWQKPWSVGHRDSTTMRPLRHNGTSYGGINVLMLWSAAIRGGYQSPFWMTFKQAQDLGGHVRRGERGSPVVYANTITKSERGEDGAEQEKRFGFMKAYTVFNCDQIEGLDTDFYVGTEPIGRSNNAIAHADTFISQTGAKVFHGGTRAYYCSATDHIQVPYRGAFRSSETYYATLAHELVHWTKHRSRLDRNFGQTRRGDQAYAREELVAELGAAFVCADLGLNPHRDINHAAYIQAWLKILKHDRRAIFTAAAHAHRAVQYLHEQAQKAPCHGPSSPVA